MSDELHLLTCFQQRVASTYHPQCSGLVGRQNRTIHNSLVTVLIENPLKWPSITDGVLFSDRVSLHSSTKYSPFKLLYNREPALPIDVNYKLSSTENSKRNHPFDTDIFDPMLFFSNVIWEEVYWQASENIKECPKETSRW